MGVGCRADELGTGAFGDHGRALDMVAVVMGEENGIEPTARLFDGGKDRRRLRGVDHHRRATLLVAEEIGVVVAETGDDVDLRDHRDPPLPPSRKKPAAAIAIGPQSINMAERARPPRS